MSAFILAPRREDPYRRVAPMSSDARPTRHSGKTGQLGGRDATVNGLGSLLDPGKTGVLVTD